MAYKCSECGKREVKWMGKCTSCGDWGTLVEVADQPKTVKSSKTSRMLAGSQIETVHHVIAGQKYELRTRLFGAGGVTPASTTFFFGEPGVGKSTFLLQLSHGLSANGKVLYVSGEESVEQIEARAKRLNVSTGNVTLTNETCLEAITDMAVTERAVFIIIDSLQTVHTQRIDKLPGSLAQAKESAFYIQSTLKAAGFTVFIVGHETKSKDMAGPRTVGHTVDAIIQLSRSDHNDLRTFIVVKNRFGPKVTEVYQMSEYGLVYVDPASVIGKEGEGIYSVSESGEIIEVVSLCESTSEYPQRVFSGYTKDRMSIILAVASRSAIPVAERDVFVEVSGAMPDVGIELAIATSLLNSIMGRDKVKNVLDGVFLIGRVRLDGNVSPVPDMLSRVNTVLNMSPSFRVITPFLSKGDYAAVVDKSRLITITNLKSFVADLLSGNFSEKGRNE